MVKKGQNQILKIGITDLSDEMFGETGRIRRFDLAITRFAQKYLWHTLSTVKTCPINKTAPEMAQIWVEKRPADPVPIASKTAGNMGTKYRPGHLVSIADPTGHQSAYMVAEKAIKHTIATVPASDLRHQSSGFFSEKTSAKSASHNSPMHEPGK